MPTVDPFPGQLKHRTGEEYVLSSRWHEDWDTYPSNNDDETLGYAPGSVWWRVKNEQQYAQHLCVFASAGSAVWIVVGVTVGGGAPTSDDDSSRGYRVGSLWSDGVGGRIYQCTDDTVGAATWGSH